MARTAAGLVCAPRAAPELAGTALARCPLPQRPLARVPGWPTPPSAWVAGFYRRGPAHLPAPAPLAELVQAPGPAFGPHDHPTTALCLAALARLPDGPALDAGCGSGLLALAWARLGKGPALALDLDPAACAQARRSAAASGLAARVAVERRDVGALPPALLAERVLLANLPAPAQAALLGRVEHPPRAIVLSGLRPGEAAALLRGWRGHGLRPVGAARAGRFERWTLVR